MIYRTIVKPKQYNFEISYASNILMLGSCFVENIGNKLVDKKLKTLINPFGILFNPISIANTLRFILKEREFTSVDLIQGNGLFHSFSHHGQFSSLSEDEALKKMNNSRIEASGFLKKTDTLIITFGSAWAYRHIKTDEIIANCHKIPNKEFKKELLEIDVIIASYKEIISKLKEINPSINIIFTISPIRHWKDGAEENNLSKSILNVAVHKLVGAIQNTHYFPAYEMVIDDLRDYRFYKEDMLHPNSVAVDYVWNGFKSSFFNSETLSLLNLIKKIRILANHKPLNLHSKKHQEFVKRQLIIVDMLSEKYPYLDFSTELLTFRNQLS